MTTDARGGIMSKKKQNGGGAQWVRQRFWSKPFLRLPNNLKHFTKSYVDF